MPHDSVISITGLQVQTDSVIIMNNNMENTMNVTMISDLVNAPMDTAIEISQGEAAIDGNESEKTIAQNIEKSEKTLEQKN